MANALVQCVRTGGRIAYPNGIYPVPGPRPDISITGYNGEPDPDILHRLYYWVRTGKIKVHIDNEFALEKAQKAHLALKQHYVGKLCFNVGAWA